MRAAACFALALAGTHASVDRARLAEMLRAIDERQQDTGDWRSVVYVEQKERGKVAVVYETVTMRRSSDQKFLILFTKPKAVAGQGYLRLDHNLWFYDPAVGKWERRTERDRIGGTTSRRADFDESHLSQQFDPEDGGEEALGVFKTQVLRLTVKPGVDVPYPVVRIWVDTDTRNVLKRQEFALSGRLLRTTYYAKWTKIHSQSKNADVWYAREIRIFDELDKESSTTLVVQSVDAKPLQANVFTKAWLESQMR